VVVVVCEWFLARGRRQPRRRARNNTPVNAGSPGDAQRGAARTGTADKVRAVLVRPQPPGQAEVNMDKLEINEENLRATMAALGKSHQAIRETLVKAGIKGTPGQPETCVLANYLKAKFNAKTVEVCADIVEVDAGSFNDDTPFAYIKTPKLIERFIENFDDGKYPELVV
jgi:hypothetical protein